MEGKPHHGSPTIKDSKGIYASTYVLVLTFLVEVLLSATYFMLSHISHLDAAVFSLTIALVIITKT